MVGGIAEMIRAEQVFLLQECVDMRWGIDRLSGIIQQIAGRSPCDGTAYGTAPVYGFAIVVCTRDDFGGPALMKCCSA